MDEHIFCPVCKNRNKEVWLIEEHDLLVCPECKTSIILTSKSPLPRYQDNWKTHSDTIYPYLRPELNQHNFANARLFYLYEDCHQCLLIGRYNAAIILMGVLLEALMKEIIILNDNDYAPTSYGSCLNKIESEGLMRAKHISYLQKFKDDIRDLYQHSKESKILRGRRIKIWPIQFEGELTMDKIERAQQDIKSGKLKPLLIPASAYPAIRSIAKQEYDRSIAISLFNTMHDFVQEALIIYFKQERYDEHHKKFGDRLQDLPHYKIE